MDGALNRTEWIDCVRGFAIALAVLGHFDQGDNPLCKWISSFHMPIFFLISGVLLSMRNAYAEQPLLPVFISKVRRLLYPYFTFSILVIVYNLFQGKTNTVLSIIRSTVLLEGYSVLWFLPALWMAECLLIAMLRIRVPLWLSAGIVLCGTSAYSALQYYFFGGAVPVDKGWIFIILNSLCRAGIGASFMLAGYCGYQLKARFECIGLPRLFLMAIGLFMTGFACCWFNAMPDMHYCVQHNPILYYASALLQSAGIIIFCALFIPKNKILGFWGETV